VSNEQLYRVVRVTTAEGRTYRTVQLDDGAPWGPSGAQLKVEYRQLILDNALRLRDNFNEYGLAEDDARA
jgi:hypothetical protein